jgi:hypothetical protein
MESCVRRPRHEAIARDALARLDESEARARKHLRELGSVRQRVAELEATLTQRRERTANAAHAHPSAPKASSPKRPTLGKVLDLLDQGRLGASPIGALVAAHLYTQIDRSAHGGLGPEMAPILTMPSR